MSSSSFESTPASLDLERLSRREVLRRGAIGTAGMVGASLLAACGASTSQRPSASWPATPASVNWRVIPVYSTQSTDPNRAAYVTNAIKLWEQTYPGSHINQIVGSSDVAQNYAKLALDLSQGQGPDAAMVDVLYFGNLRQQYGNPFDPYLADSGIAFSDFFPFAQKLMQGNGGKILGLQFTSDVRVLYYRKDLVPTPPASWNDVLTIGKPLAARGLDAYSFPGGRGEATSVTGLLPYYWAQGVELYDANGTLLLKNKAGPEYAAMLKAFQFIQTLAAQGLTPKRVTTYLNETDQNADVVAGNVAMFLGNNSQAPQLDQLTGKQFYSHWGVAPIPSFDGVSFASTSGGQMWGLFTKDPNKQKAAANFIATNYVNNAGMAAWCTIGGYLPTRTPVYDYPPFVTGTNPFTATFEQHLQKYAHFRPSIKDYQALSTQLQIAVGNIVSGSQNAQGALDAVVSQF
jgi:multiple sugar transport system substrate-binding protein